MRSSEHQNVKWERNRQQKLLAVGWERARVAECYLSVERMPEIREGKPTLKVDLP
jgi:hypothetical protein